MNPYTNQYIEVDSKKYCIDLDFINPSLNCWINNDEGRSVFTSKFSGELLTEITGTLWRRTDEDWELASESSRYKLNLHEIDRNSRFGWKPKLDMSGLLARCLLKEGQVVYIINMLGL